MTSKNRPNIILIMTDQMRFDAIHRHNNPYISTPTLDMMIDQGTDFIHAYTATPSCIPARASLMTGLSQNHTGLVGYIEGTSWNYPHFLASELSQLGYYTKAIGKMHVHPPRRSCGFHHVELHDGYLHATRFHNAPFNASYTQTDDYLDWLQQQTQYKIDLTDSGLECNSWVARPFPYEEALHPTNWATSRAIDFLSKRDPLMPFFLKLSYVRPHSPLDPPDTYFNYYWSQLHNIKPNTLTKWAEEMGFNHPVESIDAKQGILSPLDYRTMLAGYYGLITHIDHQINRFLMHLQEAQLYHNTIIIFTSDHGDQLAQHGLFRKGYSYQGSIHVPLIVFDPGKCLTSHFPHKKIVSEIIELRDILPTLVEFAGGNPPTSIDGMSFKDLIFDTNSSNQWREYLHGEHTLGEYSSHYILSLPYKYIWYSQTGLEQLFNIQVDPKENNDLASDSHYAPQLHKLRNHLISELRHRPEKFVQNNLLIAGRPLQNNLFDTPSN